MSYSDYKKPCSGQIDRYQLRHILSGLPLSEKTVLRRFAALDTVTSQPVLLETLPVDFGNESQLLLRKTLARQGIRQYAKVADWGLPVFMHEIWELDHAAAESTGLRNGNLLLIYDLNVEDSFFSLLQDGTPERCRQLLFGGLPQLCQRLHAAHQQSQGHGCLQARTLWILPEGKVGITDFAVGHLLGQLEGGVTRAEIREADPQQDLNDLKTLSAEFSVKAGYLENSEFSVRLARVSNLEELLALLQNPPADSVEPVKLAASAGNTAIPPESGSRSRLLNSIYLIAVSLLLFLLGFLAWQKYDGKKQSQREEAAAWAHSRPPLLVTRNVQRRLTEKFALRFTLNDPFDRSGALGLALFGQLSRLEILWTAGGLQIFEQLSAGRFQLLADQKWVTLPSSGTVFQLIKTPATVAIYQDQVFVAGCSLKIQNWRQLKWQSVREYPEPPALAYQKIGNLFFSDDFMHSDDALGAWEIQSGEWAVHSLQTPVRSANPFSFIGKGEGAEATAGYWFWRNYRMSCAIRPLDAGRLGVRIYRGNEQSSYSVIWQRDKPDRPEGKLVLLRQANGLESVLAESSLPFPVEQWIELSVSCNEGMLEVLVDQRPVFQIQDSNPLPGGKIALLSSGKEGTVFDDVKVVPTQALQLPPKALGNEKSLLFDKISKENPTHPGEFTHSLRMNQPELSDAQLNLELNTEQLKSGAWELALQHQGYRELCLRLKDRSIAETTAEILFRKFAYEKVLSSQSWSLDSGVDKHVLQFQVLGTEARFLYNGRCVALATELPEQDTGLAVLRQFSSSVPFFSWTQLSCSAPAPLSPAVDKVAMFSHEVSMRSWNNPVLEWAADGEYYWYQADFWQDLRVNMDLQALRQNFPEGNWGLLLGNGDPSAVLRLVYRPQEQELILEQPGVRKILNRLKCERPPENITLQKSADRILARINGKILWEFPLPEFLQGLCLAGREGKGDSAAWANAVQILAAGIRSYSFQEAPCDWSAAGGTWEVTNRWQCDPRWSFFSGVNLEGAACLWNKFQHGENVSIDFFAGPKMDTDRGKKYEYAGDFSLVLGADGRDISSGYSFLYGGWDNRGSQIVRQKKIVHENPEMKVPRSGEIHRRWFHLKVRKNGNQFSFWIDGKLSGTFTDPDVLPGRHFAIWTWKNGLMAAQFRISSDLRKPAQQPLFNSSENPRTPYD